MRYISCIRLFVLHGKECCLGAKGHENLIVPSSDKARENGRKGGKASGEARRKKANFRKVLNALLTAKIESPEWDPILQELGVDCTLESALNMAMIKEGLSGNVKAYVAIRDTIGQSTKSEEEIEKQRIELEKAREEINKQRLEIERLRKSVNPQDEFSKVDELISAIDRVAKT